MATLKARLKRHIHDRDSHHRRIAISFLWVSLFVFVGKLAGAAKEMVIAWRYGISETVDAYVFIYNLITLPVGVWFSVLTVVLVPLVARLRKDKGADLSSFRGELLGLSLLIGLLLGLLFYWGLPHLLQANWVGLSTEVIQQALNMAGPLSLLLPLGVVISLFSAWMMARGRHRNTLMEAFPALTILIVLMLPPGTIPEPLVWGTIAGFALQLAGLTIPLKKMGEIQTPTLIFASPAWRGFWGSMGIMAIGQSLMSFTVIIDQFFAAHLGVGAIATLSYANRIMALIMALGAMAISRATLPIFSEVAAKGTSDLCGLALRWAGVMFFVGLLTTIFVWLVAPWSVSILYERGAFTENDRNLVSGILKYLSIQLPFYFSGIVLVSALSSQRNYIDIAIISFILLVIKLSFLFAVFQHLNLEKLALSSAVMYFASMLLCLMFLVKSRWKYESK